MANPLGFSCRIAVSDILAPLWQQVDAHMGASMGFSAFTLALTARIMVVSHIKTFQFLIISLQKCLRCQKCSISFTNGILANFEPPWQQNDASNGPSMSFLASTWSLTAGIMGISHLRVCFFIVIHL